MKESKLEKELLSVMYRRNEEEREQVKVFDWIREQIKTYPRLMLAFHIPNGGIRNIVAATRLKRAGVKAGMPDICIPLARYEANGLWIEMKSENGRLSDEQKVIHAFLRSEGHLVYTCYSAKTAIEIIKNYLDLV